jgi:hypothetical protein
MQAPAGKAAEEGEPAQCTRSSSPAAPQPGAPLFTPVKLEAEEPAAINLSGDDFEEVEVKVEPPLPDRIGPQQISLYTPKRLRRSNNELGTAHIDKPTFSEPEISDGGSRIVFAVCIDDESIDAGTYTGQVQIGGPLGSTRTAATITVNKKDSGLFWFGVAVALLIAVVLSYLRALKVAKDKLPESDTEPWKKAWAATWRDPWLAVSTVGGLVVAFVGMWQIFAKDPAWGASGMSSFFALVGTMLSATGLAAFASSILPSKDP